MSADVAVINRCIVEPSPDSPRYCGIYRHTLIDGDKIEQIYFAEDSEGRFGALVSRRVMTRNGVTTEEIFDPPIPEHGIVARLPTRDARAAIQAWGPESPPVNSRSEDTVTPN